MRPLEAREPQTPTESTKVLHKKIELFTNNLIASLQTKTKDEKSWAVLSMSGEILFSGKHRLKAESAETLF